MTNARHIRQLLAIMSLDMRQYSWFMSQDEASTHRTVQTAIKRFQSLLKSYSGSMIADTGDGALAAFPSATDAVELALAFQESLGKRPLSVAGLGIAQFRIGIHVADAILEHGRVHGAGINVAKRLEGIADAGGILVSGSVFDHIGNNSCYSLEHLGPVRLKNILLPIEVYRVIPRSDTGILKANIRRRAEPLTYPSRKSVAVIPLADISETQDQGYFCSGLSEDIVSSLSRFHELFVIAYKSSSLFKGLDISPDVIGRELGVGYVLKGTVNRADGRLRVNVTLVDTISNRHIWSDRFEDKIEHIFDIQDKIVQMISARLSVRLEVFELTRAKSTETNSLKAYELVLIGQEYFLAYNKQGNQAARMGFERAITQDPSYARAYAALSRTHILDWRYLWTETPDTSFVEALESARTAVKLDESDARGYAELGFVQLWSKQVDVAIGLYERALDLNPNCADVLAEYADALGYSGRLHEAEETLVAAMRLNPYYPDWYLWYLADIYYSSERYEDVIHAIGKMRDCQEGYRLLAAAHGMLGNMDKADYYAARVLERQPNFSVHRWVSIQPDTDAANRLLTEGLLRAGLPN